MNLQTIQKRVEELSAELITISNDLAHLIQGEVIRQPAPVQRPLNYTSFLYAAEGDKVKLNSLNYDLMLVPNFSLDLTTVYTVVDREISGYDGNYTVLIESPNGDDAVWVHHSILTRVEG